LLPLLAASCTSPTPPAAPASPPVMDQETWKQPPVGWACWLENREISRLMGRSANTLARGDDATWNEIHDLWVSKSLDGIVAECYTVGLGELFARAPNVFLERHLAGDRAAKELARRAYRLAYAGDAIGHPKLDTDAIRAAALNLYRQRMTFSTPKEKKQIAHFIDYITAEVREWEASQKQRAGRTEG
ncbi:MAG TPA: hypothetical protein VD994_04070, partial [Prosthecobacter sp.]|nr:hypothetical protein [Prosthecobacter sp.]